MTFKIMAGLGNLKELLTTRAFWPQTDICVHTSEHNANEFLEQVG